MGFIRGFLVVIVSVLLFLSLFSLALFGILSSSLKYENVQENSATFLEASMNGLNLSSAVGVFIPLMQSYCKGKSDYDYVFSSEGYTFDIPCEVVFLGTDAIIEEGFNDLVSTIYYKQHDCDFLDCLKKSPFDGKSNLVEVLISEKAHNYWTNQFYFFLGLVFVLSLGLFFLVERKANSLIIFGGMAIVSSIIFIKLDLAFSVISNETLSNLARIFFSESFYFSVKLLVLGIAVFVLGLISKLFKIGFKLQEFFSKFKKSENSSLKKVVKKKSKK